MEKPTYYQKAVQPWDLIDAYGLNYHEGAAIKYIARNREKNGIEDLRKAISELEREIENRTAADEKKESTPVSGGVICYKCGYLVVTALRTVDGKHYHPGCWDSLEGYQD